MRSGAVVRALASRPTNVVWVRILAWRHTCMWVEFVVGSRPCSERVFFVYFGFPSPQKYTLPNSISIWNARTLFDDFLRTPKCSVGKEMSSYNFYRCLICTRARPCTRAPAPSPNFSVGTWKNGCVHIATTFLAPSPIPQKNISFHALGNYVYSALIDVKRNFEQNIPFKWFVTLVCFTWKSI